MNNFCSLESQVFGRERIENTIKINKANNKINETPLNPLEFFLPILFLSHLNVLTNAIK